MKTIKVRFHKNFSANLFGNIRNDEVFYATIDEESSENILTLCFDVPVYHQNNIYQNQLFDFDRNSGIELFGNFVIDPFDLATL
jgi:hypothetical protein